MLYKSNICEVFFILHITEFEIELEETRENQKKKIVQPENWNFRILDFSSQVTKFNKVEI